jgi:hypothetical protein
LTDAQQIAIQAFELWQKDWKTPYHSQEDLLWQAFRAGYESGLVVATRDPDAAELGWPIGA